MALGSGTYSLVHNFTWTPSRQEGTYSIQVTVRDYNSGETASLAQLFVVNSLLKNNGNKPVATATANLLVALGSAQELLNGDWLFHGDGRQRHDQTVRAAGLVRTGRGPFYRRLAGGTTPFMRA